MSTVDIDECQWHDVLPEADCPFCNPVLSETVIYAGDIESELNQILTEMGRPNHKLDERDSWRLLHKRLTDLLATQRTHLKAELLAKMPKDEGWNPIISHDEYQGYNDAVADIKEIIEEL